MTAPRWEATLSGQRTNSAKKSRLTPSETTPAIRLGGGISPIVNLVWTGCEVRFSRASHARRRTTKMPNPTARTRQAIA